MTEAGHPATYGETLRRPAMHGAFGAALLIGGLLLGMRGLAWGLLVVGALFFAASLWGGLRIVLGRNDRLVVTDTLLSYVHPVHPDRNREVPLEFVQQVSIDTGTVGRVKELKVTVSLKDGQKWTFGERFMDASQLRAFIQDVQDRLARI